MNSAFQLTLHGYGASTDVHYRGPLGAVFGIYDVGQEHLQRFVLPEMLRRISHEELADIFDSEEWRDFQVPRPLVLSYGECSSDPRVPTSFRLSNGEMQAIEMAARRCAEGYQDLLSRAVAGNSVSSVPLYEGVIGPKDRDAWSTTLHLALAERRWRKQYGRFATIEEVRAGRMMYEPKDNGKYYPPRPAILDHHGLSDAGWFGFEVTTVVSDSRLLIFVRPREYTKPGRVSFVIDLDESVLKPSDIDACFGIPTHVFGADHGGGSADVKDPPYLPYGVDPGKMCL